MIEATDVIDEQFASAVQKFSGLNLERKGNGSALINGELHYSATYEGEYIEDKYIVELKIPTEYPNKIPEVREMGGRIPPKFHHLENGSLCLGAPLQIKMKFRENPTLHGFIEDQVIPYLYSYSYFETHGKMPFGELAHGGKGIVSYYQQLFKLKSEVAILGFLRILVDDDYRGHNDCPCRSWNNLRTCHGKLLLKIKEYQTPNEFTIEYIQVLNYLAKSGYSIPKSYISKSLEKKLKKSK